MNERWRAIPGIPKLYLVSDRGRVFSIRRGIFMQPSSSGYVVLHLKGEVLTRRVTSLVKAAFPLACDLGECTNPCECWHCGFNPAVCKERRATFKQRGLEKNEDGTWGYRITEADYRKGFTRLIPREEKIPKGTEEYDSE